MANFHAVYESSCRIDFHSNLIAGVYQKWMYENNISERDTWSGTASKYE